MKIKVKNAIDIEVPKGFQTKTQKRQTIKILKMFANGV